MGDDKGRQGTTREDDKRGRQERTTRETTSENDEQSNEQKDVHRPGNSVSFAVYLELLNRT